MQKTQQEQKKRIQNKRVVYVVLSLLASIALWVYVRSEVNPYANPWVYRIPVTLVGEERLQEERSLLVTSGAETTIDLRLYGKRETVATLNRSNISITVDVSTIRSAGTFSLDYEIKYPPTVSNSAVSILERSLSSVEVTVTNLKHKTIQVRGFGGTPAEGYLADTMLCEPDEVVIHGPAEIINEVSYARVFLDRDNLERTVETTLDYVLMDKDGNEILSDDIQADVEQIDVRLPILATKDIALTVELVNGGGATEEDAVYTISPETIRISGEAEVLKGINQISLGTIDLEEVIDSATLTRTIPLPNNTQSLSGEEEAEINVKLKGLSSKSLRVTNIELINLPDEEKLDCKSVSNALSVVIRARSEVVEQIFANNIRAVADLTGYTEVGQYKVPVTVYIDGYTNAGILYEDKYEIVVNITEHKEEPENETPTEPRDLPNEAATD